MSAAFYNTPGLSGAELAAVEASASEQNAIVLSVFRTEGVALTPSDVWQISDIELLTSVRRAITTLTKHGKLVKTGEQVPGPHGVREFLWALAA